MSPISKGKNPVSIGVALKGSHLRKESVHVPVKHNPLGNSDNALLGLIQRRELRLDGVIGISHGEFYLFRNLGCRRIVGESRLVNACPESSGSEARSIVERWKVRFCFTKGEI